MQRRRIEDRTRGRHRVRVVTAIAAIGSGVLATVLSLLLTGTAATAATTNTSTSNTSGDTATQNTQSNSDQLQAPTTTPAQTDIGGGHGSSGGS
jgi:hypothetical protein